MNWIIKTASLLTLAAAMLVSCDKEQPGGNNGLGIGINIPDLSAAFDKNVIRNNGEVATLKAYYKGEDVSDKATFFQIKNGKPEVLSSRTFSSNTVGKYRFQVAYLTSTSKEIEVTVVDREIPGKVADPQPSNTSFVHRAFLNQHTGAGCGYCPSMTKLLKETLVGETADKVVLAAIRGYNGGEAGFALISNPSAEYPFLHIDYADYPRMSYQTSVEELTSMIERRVVTPAAVGISANPVYYEDTKQIIVRVAVKAAQTDEYNVGLWLMQDNFYTLQSDYLGVIQGGVKDPYHYHDNCVRLADSEYLGAHVGYPLGVLEAGKSAEWVFVFDLKNAIENSKNKGGWWESFSAEKLDDLHFAAFVTTHKGSTYTVVNAIDFPYNAPTSFEYIN